MEVTLKINCTKPGWRWALVLASGENVYLLSTLAGHRYEYRRSARRAGLRVAKKLGWDVIEVTGRE